MPHPAGKAVNCDVKTHINPQQVEALIIRGDGMNLKYVFTPPFWEYLRDHTRSTKVKDFCEEALSEGKWISIDQGEHSAE